MRIHSYSHRAFTDDLSRVNQSSQLCGNVRICLLTTRDRNHAISLLKEIVASCETPLYHFTIASRSRYNPHKLSYDIVGGDSADITSLLRHAAELKGGSVVILEDCISFLSDDGGDIRARMTLSQMLSAETKSDGLVLVFMEPPESEARLPAMLAAQFIRLTVPYPRAEELETIAREEITRATHSAGTKLDVEDIKREASRFSGTIVGLTRSAARDSLRDALAPDPQDFDAAFIRLEDRKADHLSRELAMKVLDNSDGEEPIGLDNLLEYLKSRKDKIRVTGPNRAKGILLVGPPGTGKTMLAKTVGRIVNLSVVEFRISSLMNSLLGETERRFSQAFATLEVLAPNVVFIDEIEKVFGGAGSESDGGTMMRCTGSLLSWLSENPYPNFLVATCNNLRRMGDIGLTLTRSERFDAAFFVDVPDLESRCKMLERWLDDAELASVIAELTDKFSGADLRSVVKQAKAHAEFKGTDLTEDMLKAEVERKRLRATAVYDEFQELRGWANLYCEPAQ